MSEEINKIYNRIKVTFEYGNQKVTLDCEPYKTIGEIKNKAMRKIYGANKGLHCFYLNRDLFRKENEQLGNFFPKRENITLKLMMPIRIPGEKDDYKNEFFGEPLLNTNLYTNGYIGNRYINNPTKKKVIKENKIDTILNSSKSYAISSRNNKALSGFNSVNNNNDDSPNYFCNNCNKKTLHFFCRNCQDFLCEDCKKLPKHNNHLTIKIDPFNLEENIKLYIMIVQTDIEQNIHTNEDYLNSRIISGELNNILTDLYTNFTQSRKKMGFLQFKNYFNMINEKEKNWTSITKNIIVFKVNNDINEKVKKFYEKMEKEIDELINIKKPFCLEKKELDFVDKICGIHNTEPVIKSEEEDNERIKESQILKERTEIQMKNKKEKEMNEKKELKSIQNSDANSDDSKSSSEEEVKKRSMAKRKTATIKK